MLINNLSLLFDVIGVPAELVTKDDLTIPDSYCNPGMNRNSSKESGSNGHKCPPNFDCIKLSKLGKDKLGFIGFGNFFTSLFSVYTGILFVFIRKIYQIIYFFITI